MGADGRIDLDAGIVEAVSEKSAPLNASPKVLRAIEKGEEFGDALLQGHIQYAESQTNSSGEVLMVEL